MTADRRTLRSHLAPLWRSVPAMIGGIALVLLGGQLTVIGVLLLGIAVLLLGANWLVDGAVAIARALGVSTLVIGLTIVAIGTSAPELAVNIAAGIVGHTELSFGNVVGSNIANIGLVIAIGAMVAPIAVHGQVVRRELWYLIGISAALALPALLPWQGLDGAGAGTNAFSQLEGGAMLLGLLLVLWLWYRLGRKGTEGLLAKEFSKSTADESLPAMPLACVLFLLGLGCLIAGGTLTEQGAVAIAERLGLSQALIGMTVVAVATSLPELATVVAAARKGHADLAVGNVVGSNMFNILLVLGATAAIAPVPVPGHEGLWDMAVMVLLTLLLVVVVLTGSGRKISRVEGAVLLAAYLVYMTWRVWSAARGSG